MRFGMFVVLASLTASAVAQGPPHNGPRPVDPGWYAIVNARVVQRPEAADRPTAATILVRDGRIAAVGADITVPAGATRIDCSGLIVYPGLIEPYFPSDVPALPEDQTDQHWSPMVQPQRNALDGTLVEEEDRTALRSLGYAVVAATPSGGILKGTSAVVLLDDPTETEPARVIKSRAYATASLRTNRSGYPNSEMGAIALLRQSLSDGNWYERCRRTLSGNPAMAARLAPSSRALTAIADQKELPLWFDTQNELQALRALRVAAEFQRRPVLVGSGMEFRRLAALTAANVPLVMPLHLPEAPDVATAALADRVSLRQLQSWENAPSNSKRLLDAGLTVAWTTARLPKKQDFPARVRDARDAGVSNRQALAAVTTTPARLLGIDAACGTIATGKLANFVVTDGGLFDKDRVVRDVWVGGVRHIVNKPEDEGLDGSWRWTTGWPGGADAAPKLTIDGGDISFEKPKDGQDESAAKIRGSKRTARTATCRIEAEALGDGVYWLQLRVEPSSTDGNGNAADPSRTMLRGALRTADGKTFPVALTRAPAAANEPQDAQDRSTSDDDAKASSSPAATWSELPTPLGGYGFEALPEATPVLIQNATLWTCDGRGIIRGGAIYLRDGKIAFAGKADLLPALARNTRRIDAGGRHVTPGIIDCHSHTGISRGVNESGQAVTSEVRIEDVLNPDDANWYRQLAGGVTAVNQLHGSANVIGGQSNTVKNRYGVLEPNDMFFAGSMPGIKFALGENPRRVNRRSGSNTRYPNTRMGVEGLLRDRFAAAATYAREQASYKQLSPRARANVLPPRPDFELEALAEILAKKRWIHCHSYRQDEIFMLCQLADEYGIQIGTFQHVLEGYKVADAIRRSAVGASSFSDWWAYKLEVYDAIPDNGAILHEQGVVTSFNSDSNEHARRLNTEAGKAVKYGGVAPIEALHFVTRNPAIQLGIFASTGSLTRGKDADIAIWSADPLSYAAICEHTFVDGREMFSRKQDAERRTSIQTERARLLKLVVSRGKSGDKKRSGAREGDPRDAYWAAEEGALDYCCRTFEQQNNRRQGAIR
ncbi:MAG: amidohydrolase family protein [Planctomycetota bacterium]